MADYASRRDVKHQLTALEVMDLVRGGGVETLAVLADDTIATASVESAGETAGSR